MRGGDRRDQRDRDRIRDEGREKQEGGGGGIPGLSRRLLWNKLHDSKAGAMSMQQQRGATASGRLPAGPTAPPRPSGTSPSAAGCRSAPGAGTPRARLGCHVAGWPAPHAQGGTRPARSPAGKDTPLPSACRPYQAIPPQAFLWLRAPNSYQPTL